jgi:predicted nucleic acid-binding protein
VSGTGLVIDTNIFVAARNRYESGWTACRGFLARVDSGEQKAIVSAITLAELRAGFSAEEIPTVWRPMLSHFLTSPNFRVESVSAPIADRAGALRSIRRLSLADAVIVATGLELGADGIVTQDASLRKRQSEIPIRSP